MNLHLQLLKKACVLSNLEVRLSSLIRDVIGNFYHLKKAKIQRIRRISG